MAGERLHGIGSRLSWPWHAGADDARPRFQPAVLAALRHRNYRLYWIGTLVATTGDWMDQVAFAWLMWELTASPAALGMLAFVRGIPILFFTLFGGALADRFERRRLMQVTQSVAMVLALLLALLVAAHVVQVWQVLVIAALRGTMMSVNLPTRQALLSDIVDREHLSNAIALNSATRNVTRIVGGSLGGLLITVVGTAGVFLINGLSTIILIVALAAMTIPPLVLTGPQTSILRSIGDGFTYLRGHATLRTLMILALAPMIFGMPYITLLPIFADNVLGIGHEGFGLLLACTGVGALTGALIVTVMNDYRRRGQMMLYIMIWYGALLFLFSRSTIPLLSYVLLFGVGAGQTSYLAFNMTLLQTHASDDMRGRVISFFYLNRGLVPLGTAAAGFAAEWIGVQTTVMLMGLTVAALGLFTFMRVPKVRDVA